MGGANTSVMEGTVAVALSPPGVPSPTDEQLLTRAGVDPDAFVELYHRHFRHIVAFAVRRCERPGEVADLVAAVWLEVIDSVERYDPRHGRALPWMLGIAANLAASEARRRRRERQAVERLAGRRLLEEDEAQRLDTTIDASRVAPRVRRAMANLPPGERAMAELVVLDELTPAAAAVALGLGGAAGRMRLGRARRKLRAALADRPTSEAHVRRRNEVIT
jgi:RNA polymerase sigma factor (sigma-70 family)